MSPLEDEIRETLRSEAGRLREVRPLRLPPSATRESRGRIVSLFRWGPRLRPWLAPAAAAAVVVVVAATLVTLRSA